MQAKRLRIPVLVRQDVLLTWSDLGPALIRGSNVMLMRHDMRKVDKALGVAVYSVAITRSLLDRKAVTRSLLDNNSVATKLGVSRNSIAGFYGFCVTASRFLSVSSDAMDPSSACDDRCRSNASCIETVRMKRRSHSCGERLDRIESLSCGTIGAGKGRITPT